MNWSDIGTLLLGILCAVLSFVAQRTASKLDDLETRTRDLEKHDARQEELLKQIHDDVRAIKDRLLGSI